MTFIPTSPREVIAEALNRFGANIEEPEVLDQVCEFILKCLLDLEKGGHMVSVPWCVAVSVSPLGQLEFVMIPATLKGRTTRYVKNEVAHVITDVDTSVATEAVNLFTGLAQHAHDVEKHLNTYYRN